MAETQGKPENVSLNHAAKPVTLIFVFIILVPTFHMLLMIPTALIGALLVRVGGNPVFWGKTLGVITVLPAGLGALAVCKLMWRNWK